MELHFPWAHVTVGFKSCLLCSLTIFHAIIFQELVQLSSKLLAKQVLICIEVNVKDALSLII